MSDHSDGINETLEAALRVGLTMAGRVAEQMARDREQRHRDAQAVSEQEARRLESRFDAERAAARAAVAPAAQSEWWDTARAPDIVRVWEVANAWSASDPEAASAVDRIGDELRNRYGLDVHDLQADEARVQDAIDQRALAIRDTGAARGDVGGAEEAEAAALVALADRADREADRAEGSPAPDSNATEVDATVDVAERRRAALMVELEGVEDKEAVEARVVADASQARPATDAVVEAPGRPPRAKQAGRDAGRATERIVQR